MSSTASKTHRRGRGGRALCGNGRAKAAILTTDDADVTCEACLAAIAKIRMEEANTQAILKVMAKEGEDVPVSHTAS